MSNWRGSWRRWAQPYLGVASRVRELKSRMVERYSQWIEHRATSRAWGFAKKALDARMHRIEHGIDKVASSADLFDRFIGWIDDANARLRATDTSRGTDNPSQRTDTDRDVSL